MKVRDLKIGEVANRSGVSPKTIPTPASTPKARTWTR